VCFSIHVEKKSFIFDSPGKGASMSSLSKAIQNEILAGVDVYARVAAINDDRPLSTSETAIFLGYSVTTLERMRADGTGPAYDQLAVPGKGPNTKVIYRKSYLTAFQMKNKLSNSMEAAIRRGQAFATILDIAQEEAFYIDADGNVAGMVERTPLGVVVDRIGEWGIAWMPVVEAASRRWADLGAHKEFAEEVRSVLSDAMHGVHCGVEGTEIASMTRKAMKGQRTGIDGPRRD